MCVKLRGSKGLIKVIGMGRKGEKGETHGIQIAGHLLRVDEGD